MGLQMHPIEKPQLSVQVEYQSEIFSTYVVMLVLATDEISSQYHFPI